jgi:hypothetical protein
MEHILILYCKVFATNAVNICADVTPTLGGTFISASIIDPVQKLWLLRKWDIVIDINSNNEIFYITQSQEMVPKDVEHVDCV